MYVVRWAQRHGSSIYFMSWCFFIILSYWKPVVFFMRSILILMSGMKLLPHSRSVMVDSVTLEAEAKDNRKKYFLLFLHFHCKNCNCCPVIQFYSWRTMETLLDFDRGEKYFLCVCEFLLSDAWKREGAYLCRFHESCHLLGPKKSHTFFLRWQDSLRQS